jgi:hypothetical protein
MALGERAPNPMEMLSEAMTRTFTTNQFLNTFRRDVKSQFGEDGIIEKIFEIIGPGSKWCCEFGAWDGEHCSNTYNLIRNKGWSGVLFEGDGGKCRTLQQNYRDRSDVYCMNRLVGWEGPNALEKLLSETPIPKDFDLLSIDIDGNDYHVWASLEKYRPRVVIVEFNPCVPNNIEFIQVADAKVHQGVSILSLTELAKEKGYELICVNAENAFFIVRELFPKMNIQDNSIEAIKYYREPLQVFQLFDGTLVFAGEHCLYWYGLPVDFNRLQVLPGFVRRAGTSWGGNVVLRGALKLLRTWRTRANPLREGVGSWKL